MLRGLIMRILLRRLSECLFFFCSSLGRIGDELMMG